MSDWPTSAPQDLTWLLQNLVNGVPDTRSAVLLSSDGLAKYWHGIDANEAEVLAATASSLCSVARSVGARFGSGDGVRQVVAELSDVVLFVTTAGPNAVLATLAGRETDPGVLGYEMAQLVKRVPSHLATPPRHPISAPGNGLG
ncbi:MAG TPA: roadblock/LC7 domain-containing protein [Pseudonocardiaceae bacterium]|jgi:predicted regulator of Ras-like GTPase activity (Roadblock/LC7/MglB family)|nr:roadblock/LC7 domain-containing protein [Pseudonocardiaceae bacterium]